MIDYTQYGTFEDFKAFVKAQPADREIDNSRGWFGCAVGDYLRSTSFYSGCGKYDEWHWVSATFSKELVKIIGNYYNCPNTYGGMAELLDKY